MYDLFDVLKSFPSEEVDISKPSLFIAVYRDIKCLERKVVESQKLFFISKKLPQTTRMVKP